MVDVGYSIVDVGDSIMTSLLNIKHTALSESI